MTQIYVVTRNFMIPVVTPKKTEYREFIASKQNAHVKRAADLRAT